MILDPAVQTNYDTLSVSQRLERARHRASSSPRSASARAWPSNSTRSTSATTSATSASPKRPSCRASRTARVRKPLTSSAQRPPSSTTSGSSTSTDATARLDLRASFAHPRGGRSPSPSASAATWDLRDNPFNATRGMLFAAQRRARQRVPLRGPSNNPATITSHFLRFTGRFSGYMRLTAEGTALAASLAAGYNLQLNSQERDVPRPPLLPRRRRHDPRLPRRLGRPAGRGRRIQNRQEGRDGHPVTIDRRRPPRRRLLHQPAARAPRALSRDNVPHRPLPRHRQPLGRPHARSTSLQLRYALGAGLRIATPIGPIALDYGINLDRRATWEDFGAFHFSIGLF